MKTINKQPKIRFKGYTDEWQQRKLGEIAEIIMGQSPKGENYTENPDDHILVQGNADMKNGRVVPRVWTTQITKQANPEDIILSVRAPVGDVGKTDFNVVLGRGVAAIKGNEFIYQNLKKMKETGFWTRFSTGSTFESINSTDLKDALLLLPSNEEQIEIGNFFKQLDDTIALHQRKLEALEKTKKSFLQKMFPKKDETKPEIRFAGYPDDWEQRKLGEVSERVRGNDGRMDLPTLTISAGKGWLDQRERFSGNIAGKEQKNYTLLSKNELSYNKGNSKLAKYGVVYKLGTYKEALVPRVYHSFRTTRETDPDFIEYMFATKLPDRELGKLVTSGARMDGLLNINYDDFMGIKINIPYLQEQQKIGTFFKQLDDTIALHQRQLEVLKNMKTSFLQKMYI
ncbi:restriction endonuclease subunit S [Vagococcus lutrae]|uniref:restriction endonuclease subunit S n=1 Tax=Vagococcus lutrae TaxID=81947 RepID=UPI00200F12A8|nr:restriction endonuclease subunit S [Vagococcus lutrae]MDT2806216.1 restriction endonuclease subunit S [Vagococcus lutrae]MDT2824508.1 restriction endonuclease subunit S [Vagococcus lutrae]UQF19606.1 restriction endonuclease subunit S [Vagococcus lutrae]